MRFSINLREAPVIEKEPETNKGLVRCNGEILGYLSNVTDVFDVFDYSSRYIDNSGVLLLELFDTRNDETLYTYNIGVLGSGVLPSDIRFTIGSTE